VINPDSYNCWATRIVLETGKPSFKDASCCKVEVVKGAEGERFAGFFCKSFTLKSASAQDSIKALASLKVLNSFVRTAFRPLFFCVRICAVNLKDVTGKKF